MKKKTLLIALLVLLSGQAFASDEISIVVSSDGVTKDEAIKMALRSAIEQTFGAFVSSNTTVLDYQLVKDEIVSLSNGNVKSYEILTENTLPNNRYFVTLRATICMNKLVNYINSNSNGSTVEVNMDSFDKNIRLAEMNKIAEKKVLDNVFAQVLAMNNFFDYELQLEEPTLSSEAWYCDDNGKFKTEYGDFYRVKGKVLIKYNNNTDLAVDLLANTLNQVKMSKEEIKQYEKMNIKYCSINNKNRGFGTSFKMETLDLGPYQAEHKWGCVFPTDERLYLRNASSFMGQSPYPYFIREEFNNRPYEHFSSILFVQKINEFIIGDNVSTPTKLKLGIDCIERRYRVGYSVYCKGYKFKYVRYSVGDVVAECDINIFIPKEQASIYKTFSVYPK